MIPSTVCPAIGNRAASPATGAAPACLSRSLPAVSCHSVMFTATSRRGRDVSAIRRSWVPSPLPTSRITPPVGSAEASVLTSRRQACSASRSAPGPSHSPSFSQPGATARKKSGPMLSYTRAAGFLPCLNTAAACRTCRAVHPAIHAGLAAISHPPPTGGFPSNRADYTATGPTGMDQLLAGAPWGWPGPARPGSDQVRPRALLDPPRLRRATSGQHLSNHVADDDSAADGLSGPPGRL
jgi:hypothetical protein